METPPIFLKSENNCGLGEATEDEAIPEPQISCWNRLAFLLPLPILSELYSSIFCKVSNDMYRVSHMYLDDFMRLF